MGITILIKIRTDQLNEIEKETTKYQTPTDPPANPTEADSPHSYSLTENSLNLHPSTPAPTETTNEPREKHEPKCGYYFGYVSSGDKIPEECLTCSKLLNCLTNKGGIQEEE